MISRIKHQLLYNKWVGLAISGAAIGALTLSTLAGPTPFWVLLNTVLVTTIAFVSGGAFALSNLREAMERDLSRAKAQSTTYV